MAQFSEINNKTEWDEFIVSQAKTPFFQSWNWGEFEEGLGNPVSRYGIIKEGKVKGVFMTVEHRAKRGSFLHIRNGPVMDFEDREHFDEFVKFIRNLGKERNVWFVRISPWVSKESDFFKWMKEAGFVKAQIHSVDAEVSWILDVSQSEEEILNGMRKNTRYYIRRAEKDGVEILQTKDIKNMEDFWPIFEDSVKRQKWSAYSKDYLVKEFETLAKDDEISLFLAKWKGEFIAGSMIIFYGNQAVYHHSGSLTKHLKIPAQYLIQWEAIKEAKRRGKKFYNFWGIAPTDNPKDPWFGLSFFKKGFGGFREEFIHSHDLPISKKYWLTHWYEKVERKWRGY